MWTSSQQQHYALHGRLLKDYSLRKHNTWGLTGSAAYAYWPSQLAECARFYQWRQAVAPELPVWWLGLGSNSWLPDQGLPGVVLMTQKGLAGLSVPRAGMIYAEAGVACAKLAKFAHRQGYASSDFFAGIPGTVGGALRMNAGAFGGDTWSSVVAVYVLNECGVIERQLPSAFEIGYRRCHGLPPGHYFVAAEFEFSTTRQPGALSIETLLSKRQASQPIGTRNCGSVFRNPPGDYAARLIEGCGLKGVCRGQWQVSEKHANFIINRGEGKSEPLRQLILDIQARVRDRYQITLEPEVCFLGQTIWENDYACP